MRPLSGKDRPEPVVAAGMQLDPGQALGRNAAVDGIMDRSQRMPRLYDDPLHLRAPVIAVVADESVDDWIKVIERWGKRHAEHDRWPE